LSLLDDASAIDWSRKRPVPTRKFRYNVEMSSTPSTLPSEAEMSAAHWTQLTQSQARLIAEQAHTIEQLKQQPGLFTRQLLAGKSERLSVIESAQQLTLQELLREPQNN